MTWSNNSNRTNEQTWNNGEGTELTYRRCRTFLRLTSTEGEETHKAEAIFDCRTRRRRSWPRQKTLFTRSCADDEVGKSWGISLKSWSSAEYETASTNRWVCPRSPDSTKRACESETRTEKKTDQKQRETRSVSKRTVKKRRYFFQLFVSCKTKWTRIKTKERTVRERRKSLILKYSFRKFWLFWKRANDGTMARLPALFGWAVCPEKFSFLLSLNRFYFLRCLFDRSMTEEERKNEVEETTRKREEETEVIEEK